MTGVLVESSTSPPHVFFPFELSSSASIACYDSGGGGGDASSHGVDAAPVSPRSPISHLPYLDSLLSSPPSPSFRTRDMAQQRFLPKSNLGLGLNGALTESSLEYSSDLVGMPIPSPKNGLYSSGSTDPTVGSPRFTDSSSNGVGSPIFPDVFSALHKFLPSNMNDDESWPADTFPAIDAYSCDDFRMYEFKVKRCMRGRSHDWTECPFAHPGEKARRRDPRRIHYSGTACPDFRKGSCKRGDACEYAHGVFECWLHPARYRTQPCKDGRACRRRVCFFAHTVEQLRVLPSASSAVTSPTLASNSPRNHFSTVDSSPLRQALAGSLLAENLDYCGPPKEEKVFVTPSILRKAMEGKGCGSGGYALSPSSVLPAYLASSPSAQSPPLSPSSSPPLSPELCWQRNLGSPQTHVHSLLSNAPEPRHRMHLNRLQTMPTISIPPDAAEYTGNGANFDDMPFSLPASAHVHSSYGNDVREMLHSLQALQLCSRIDEFQKSASMPSSPRTLRYLPPQHSPLGQSFYRSIPGTPNADKVWDSSPDSPPLRVESGRNLRAEIYGKIGKDNGVVCSEGPDLGWVNELVK